MKFFSISLLSMGGSKGGGPPGPLLFLLVDLIWAPLLQNPGSAPAIHVNQRNVKGRTFYLNKI